MVRKLIEYKKKIVKCKEIKVPNLEVELSKIIYKKFGIILSDKNKMKLDHEIGYIAIESILDQIESFRNVTEFNLYFESLIKNY